VVLRDDGLVYESHSVASVIGDHDGNRLIVANATLVAVEDEGGVG
jgi:hypothetical protein